MPYSIHPKSPPASARISYYTHHRKYNPHTIFNARARPVCRTEVQPQVAVSTPQKRCYQFSCCGSPGRIFHFQRIRKFIGHQLRRERQRLLCICLFLRPLVNIFLPSSRRLQAPCRSYRESQSPARSSVSVIPFFDRSFF